MIDLAQDHLQVIREILAGFLTDQSVWAFGSRVDGTSSEYSDLDLVIVGKEPLGPELIETIKDQLSESDLPIFVDLLDWHSISSDFQKIIEQSWEPFISAPSSG